MRWLCSHAASSEPKGSWTKEAAPQANDPMVSKIFDHPDTCIFHPLSRTIQSSYIDCRPPLLMSLDGKGPENTRFMKLLSLVIFPASQTEELWVILIGFRRSR